MRHSQLNDQDWNYDTQLDRLVDGELSPIEYRELLEALESEPDGWRRTAMTFLQAQAFGQDLATLRHEIDVPASIDSASITPSARDHGTAPLALAIAASFLVAFGLGAWWRSNSIHSDNPPVSSVATGISNGGSGNPSSRTGTELTRDVTPARDELPRQSVPPEQLTLLVDRGDGQSDRVDMPVYDKDDAYARWLAEQPLMPLEVERDLRRAGFRIERQRQWAPVRLGDGRRAVFPVDELQITPVSDRSY